MNSNWLKLALFSALFVASAHAEDGKYLSSEAAVKKYYAESEPEADWQHRHLLGTYDQAQLQRGFQVYREVCAACHALDYVAFRDLEALGYNKDEVKAFAAQSTVSDGPNDEGEMYERPAKPSDKIPGPFANDQAAMAAFGGALPPALGLIVKAREGHEDYVYSLLTGFADAPADVQVLEGKYYNPHFASLVLSMAPPLADEQVSYADGTKASVEQMAEDVAAFLAWTAEPKLNERKEMGVMVMLFLGIFTLIAYLSYRKIWAPIKRGESAYD